MAQEANGGFIVTFSTLGRNKPDQLPEHNPLPNPYTHGQTNLQTTTTQYPVQQGYNQYVSEPRSAGQSTQGSLYLPPQVQSQLGYQYNSTNGSMNQGFYTTQQTNVYPNIQERQSIPGYYGSYVHSGHIGNIAPFPESAVAQQHQQLTAHSAEPPNALYQTRVASGTLFTTNIPQSLDSFQTGGTRDITGQIPVIENQADKHPTTEAQINRNPITQVQVERTAITEAQIEQTPVTVVQVERTPITDAQVERTSIALVRTIDTKVQVGNFSAIEELQETDSAMATPIKIVDESSNGSSQAVINQMVDEEDDYATVGEATVISKQVSSHQNPPQKPVITMPKPVIASQSGTVSKESIKTAEKLQSAGDDNSEIYTMVNRPKSSAQSNSESEKNRSSGNDTEPIYFKPAVPEKTADAYLEKDQESVTSSNGERFDSTTSSKAEMMQFAEEVRQKHYTDMKFDEKLTEENNNEDSDEDDYATVEDIGQFVPQTQVSANTVSSTPNQNDHPPVENNVPTINGTPSEQDMIEGATNQVQQLDIISKVSIPLGFRLPSSRVVLLHYTNITQLKVKFIVNAANGKLKHGGGVAGAIAKAAGKDFEKECKKFMKNKEEIKISKVVITGSGKLPCDKVMHAVGPKWSDYSDKAECIQLLKDTFINVFKQCSADKAESVAVPPISSGIFGVPVDHVMNAMYEAILNLDDLCPNPQYPNKIHFVDIKDKVLLSVALRLKTESNKTLSGHDVQLQDLLYEEVRSEIDSVIVHEEPKGKKQKGWKLQKSKGHGSFPSFSSHGSGQHKDGKPIQEVTQF